MKNFGAKWLAVAAVVGAAAGMSLNGCGGGGGTPTTGKGGSAGSSAAGRGGTGGSSTAGTGGSSTAGRGGSTAGTGGSTAGTSGTAGTGGSSNSDGGAGTNGGLPCPGTATFDTDVQSFQLNTFAAAGNLANLEGGTPATATWIATQGDPGLGAVKISAPYSDYNQFVDLQRGLGSTMLKNWTGYKMHVRVKVESGLNPSSMNPAGVQPYVNTGASYNYCGGYTNLKTGNGWNDYVLDLSTCTAPVDPSMVIAFGVSIQAGSGSDGDGGVNSMKPTAAVIYIDSFWLEGSCGGTGGAGGGTAGAGGGTAGAAGSTAGAGGGTAGAAGSTAGAGGSAGAAGSTAGAGGSAGAAGSNTDGGTAASPFYYLFNTTNEGFALNTFSATGNLANVEGGTPATLGFDATVGNPNNGSLKMTATYTGYNQFLIGTLGISPGANGKNKTVHAWVMVDAATGGGANFGGGAQILANAIGYIGANGPYTTLTPGQWKEITLDLGAAHTANANFDDSQIIQLSVQFHSGGQPEGGTFAGPVNAVFHVDTITDGSGGGPPPALSHTFDTSVQGYTLSTSITTPDGGTVPALSFDSAVGEPSPGSLKVVASFTNYNQDFDVVTGISPLADITGKMVHVKVKLDSGTLPAAFVQFHLSTTTGYVYASKYVGSLTSGAFTDIVFDPATITDTTWKANQLIQVGVKIGAAAGPEGGAFTAPGPLTFHIDSIVAQ